MARLLGTGLTLTQDPVGGNLTLAAGKNRREGFSSMAPPGGHVELDCLYKAVHILFYI